MSTIIKHKQFPKFKSWTMDLCGRPLTIEVGKVADQQKRRGICKHRAVRQNAPPYVNTFTYGCPAWR